MNLGFISKRTNAIRDAEIIINNDDIGGDGEVLVSFERENGKGRWVVW